MINRPRRNTKILIILVLILAFFLRFYRLSDNFAFSGEFGDNLLDIKNATEKDSLPLVGPPTSRSWLYFGPFYYWLMIPVMKFFNFNPLAAAWFGIFAGTLVVVLNYYVIGKIFGQKVGRLSSFFIAISPLWVSFSKDARFYFLATLVFYPFVWSLYQVWQGNKKFLFWGGFFYGLFFSFHYSPIILLPVLVIFFWLKRKEFSLVNYATLFMGFFVSVLPILLYDSKNGFTMVRNFLLWIPYRMAGFVGLYPKNTVTALVIKDNLFIINKFFGQSFVAEPVLWPVVTVLVLGFLGVIAFRVLKSWHGRLDFSNLFIVVTVLAGLVAIFVHGSAPIHYFLPLFPIPPILFSTLVIEVWKKSRFGFAAIGLITLFVILNLRFFSSLKAPKMSYNLQLKVASVIVQDVQGAPFQLSRVGPFDYFEGDYAQNYRYLLWWLGNEPVEGAKLRYTIYEDTTRLPKKPKAEVFEIGPILILKEKDAI